MFTVEIKINGISIGYVYGRNLGEIADGRDECNYLYEYYEVGKELTKGNVVHTRTDGIERLVCIILNDVVKKKKGKSER